MNSTEQPAVEGRVERHVEPLVPEHSIWYEACKWGTPTIQAVRVLRETAYQIVLADCSPGNARRAKADTYFRTWAEAREHLLRETKRELDTARVALAHAQDRHRNVKRMRPNARLTAPDTAQGTNNE